MGLTLDQARKQIDSILARYDTARKRGPRSILPSAITAGKTYEAWVLCDVLEKLTTLEGYSATLQAGARVVLKSAPGPINSTYAHFRLDHPHRARLDLWTDVEFVTLSASRRGIPAALVATADYHELDIVVVPTGTLDRPRHSDIKIGVECKNVGYTKDMLRALLGVRRELSLLVSPEERTDFTAWPRNEVPAHPSSCLLGYSTDARISAYAQAAAVFGVDLMHEPLP
jgi:hypothetical protein